MLKSFLKIVRKNVLLVFLLLGILSGFLLGVLLNGTVQQSTESRKLAMFIGFPGELFLRMLKLVLLPFVVSSVVTSLTMIDKNTAGKLGKRAAVYFVVTTLIANSLAVVIGAVIIKPQAHEIEEETELKTGSSPIYAVLDML
ncbi:excitatory amino acid transporter 2-like, partial [Paramuricea clavata]